MKLKNLTAENWNFIIDYVEVLPQGTHLWYKKCPFPRRVYWDPLKDPNYILRVLAALGQVKKTAHLILSYTKLAFPRTFNFNKWKEFLYIYAEHSNWILEEFYIKDNEFSVPVWECGIFAKNLLINLGFDEDKAISLAKIVMMFLEFDNAYRYMDKKCFT